MNIMLDTHLLIYLLIQPEKLSHNEIEYLNSKNAKFYFSAISIWEISIKFNLGRMEFLNLEPNKFSEWCLESGLFLKDIDIIELGSFYLLPQTPNHKDPFDRMLIWQCIKKNFTLMSKDRKFEAYKVFGLNLITA